MVCTEIHALITLWGNWDSFSDCVYIGVINSIVFRHSSDNSYIRYGMMVEH